MESLESKPARNQKFRKVKICIDLPNQIPYNVQFKRKKDGKLISAGGMYCNKEAYSSDYMFNPKEPYVIGLGDKFEGDILINNINGEELCFPIEKGLDDITLALVQPEEKPTGKWDSPRQQVNFVKETKMLEGENLTFLKTSNSNFNKFKNKVTIITDDIQSDMHTLFLENRSIVYGVLGDVSQEFWAVKGGVWKDIKGLEFYIKEIKGKMYVVLKGFAGLRDTLKGTQYLLSNPQIGAFALNAKDLVSWSSIVNGTKITIFISSAFALIDYFTKNEGKADFTDIMINLLTGMGKALISYWVGTLAALAIIGGATLLGLASAPALAVFAFGAVVSIVAGVTLNLIDDKYGWTESLQKKINELQESFNKKINEIEKDADNALYNFYEDFRREFYYWLNSHGNIGISYDQFR